MGSGVCAGPEDADQFAAAGTFEGLIEAIVEASEDGFESLRVETLR